MGIRIKSIRRIPVEALPVFNLTVENDPTYHAEGVLVHNCRCDWEYGFDTDYDTDEARLAAGIAMIPPGFGASHKSVKGLPPKS